jgi:hypothetical protein
MDYNRNPIQYSVLKTSVLILCILFIVTQIAAIPPHVLYSDPGETVVFAEGHYTAVMPHLVDWMISYGTGPISVYEQGIWINTEIEYQQIQTISCGGNNVIIRGEVLQPYNSNQIYDSGTPSVIKC